MPEATLREQWIRKATLSALVLVLLPLAYSLVRPAWAASRGDEPFLEKAVDPEGKGCVRDPDEMRFQHWELLRQMREEVVRYGRRSDVGLFSCRDCHQSRVRFCDRCHEKVSLIPDCFHCHYYP